MSAPLVFPTVHMNGTSKDALVEQLCNASIALQDAVHALAEAEPNGRDYYLQGRDVLEAALEAHRRRITAVLSVKAELDTIAEHIAG